jgi:hypothetical protein
MTSQAVPRDVITSTAHCTGEQVQVHKVHSADYLMNLARPITGDGIGGSGGGGVDPSK